MNITRRLKSMLNNGSYSENVWLSSDTTRVYHNNSLVKNYLDNQNENIDSMITNLTSQPVTDWYYQLRYTLREDPQTILTYNIAAPNNSYTEDSIGTLLRNGWEQFWNSGVQNVGSIHIVGDGLSYITNISELFIPQTGRPNLLVNLPNGITNMAYAFQYIGSLTGDLNLSVVTDAYWAAVDSDIQPSQLWSSSIQNAREMFSGVNITSINKMDMNNATDLYMFLAASTNISAASLENLVISLPNYLNLTTSEGMSNDLNYLGLSSNEHKMLKKNTVIAAREKYWNIPLTSPIITYNTVDDSTLQNIQIIENTGNIETNNLFMTRQAMNNIPATNIVAVGVENITPETNDLRSFFSNYYSYGGGVRGVNLSNMTTLLWLNNTSEVNNMSYMFYNLKNLRDVALFDTSNVTDAYEMFCHCDNLSSIPAFDFNNLTHATKMFAYTNLTEIPVSVLNSGSLVNIREMMMGTNVKTVGNLYYPNVRALSSLFENCVNLTSVGSFNFPDAPGGYSIFENCYNLTEVGNLSFNSNEPSYSPPVAILDELFIRCTNLKNIGAITVAAQTNTGINLTYDLQNMFYGCKSLENIPKVINVWTNNIPQGNIRAAQIFAYTNGIKNWSNVNPLWWTKVNNGWGAFMGATNVTVQPNIRLVQETGLYGSFFQGADDNTLSTISNLSLEGGNFYNFFLNTNIKQDVIDNLRFDVANITNLRGIFCEGWSPYTTAITSIPSGLMNLQKATKLTSFWHMFGYWGNGTNVAQYGSVNREQLALFFNNLPNYDKFQYDSPDHYSSDTLASNIIWNYAFANTIAQYSLFYENTFPEVEAKTGWNIPGIRRELMYNLVDNSEYIDYIYGITEHNGTNPAQADWVSDMVQNNTEFNSHSSWNYQRPNTENIHTINFLQNSMLGVENFSTPFARGGEVYFSNLENLIFSDNTATLANVKNWASLTYHMTSIKNLSFGGYNTLGYSYQGSKMMENTYSMFAQASQLTYIPVNMASLPYLTNAAMMFYGAANITNFSTAGTIWNLPNLVNAYAMFSTGGGYGSTSGIMNSIFYINAGIALNDISSLMLGQAQYNRSNMFNKIPFANAPKAKADRAFSNTGISNTYLGNIFFTSAYDTFAYCNNLTTVPVSILNNKLTIGNCYHMFANSPKLTHSSVNNILEMIPSRKNIYLRETNNCTSTSDPFLTRDLGWYMFAWPVANPNYNSSGYYLTPNLSRLNSITIETLRNDGWALTADEYNCYFVKSDYLSGSVRMNNTTNMYADSQASSADFTTTQLYAAMSDVFRGTYAPLDITVAGLNKNGWSGRNGSITLNNMAPSFSAMFSYLNEFFIEETDCVQYWQNAFANCTNLTSVLGANMAAGINMYRTFYNDYKLKRIPGSWSGSLGQMINSNCTNTAEMFYNCSNMYGNNLYVVSSWGTNLQNATRMFFNCQNIVSIGSLGLNNVTSAAAMFSNCRNLYGIAVSYAWGQQNVVGSVSNLNLGKCTDTTSMFANCVNLQYVQFSNAINDINLAHSPNWNMDCVRNTINYLPAASSTLRLTVNSKVYSQITSEERAILTAKNWSLYAY